MKSFEKKYDQATVEKLKIALNKLSNNLDTIKDVASKNFEKKASKKFSK